MDIVDSLSDEGWRALPPADKFRRYLTALGLPSNANADRLRRTMEREHPTAWKEFAKVFGKRHDGDLTDDVYALKNTSLRFSLLVTVFERAELHETVFAWIEARTEPTHAILDVGCENGFLTCLLALRWPGARVVGIDRSAKAIERARELATRLKLTNVEFAVGVASAIPEIFPGMKFDVITTITVLHDGDLMPTPAKLPAAKAGPFVRLIGLGVPSEYSVIAAALAGPMAVWVAAERSPSPAVLSAWCQGLDQVGLQIDWSASARLKCEDGVLTIVGARSASGRTLNLEEVRGFWLSPEFNRWGTPGAPPWALRDQLAEAFFAQVSPKDWLDRLVATDSANAELHRLEVWVAGPFALYYHVIPGRWETHLQFRGVSDLAAMRRRWQEVASQLRGQSPADIHFEESHTIPLP